ncbi:MAG: ABC transporter substrate-binding protein [Solirubrobacterales bacterium]
MSNDTLWYTRCPVPTAFSIAVREGWLDDELTPDGLTVQSLAVSTDPAMRNAHFEQTAPNFFRHGGNIPPLVAASRGRPVRIIGLSITDGIEPILALPDSGIETVADLRGKRLAVPRRVHDPVDFWRASVLNGFRRALASADIGEDEVEWIDIPVDRTYVGSASAEVDRRRMLWDAMFVLGHQREDASAMVRGEVDAMYAAGAIAATIQGFTGARSVIDVGPVGPLGQHPNNGTPLVLSVTADLLDARPDIVARVVARVLEAGIWARQNVEVARRATAAEIGIAEELVERSMTPEFAAQLEIDLSPEKLAALRAQLDFLDSNGFLAGPVDLDEIVVHEPLEAARELLERKAEATAA